MPDILYQGRRMRIERETVRLPSGAEKDRIVVRPGKAVAILPRDGDTCVLIRQYRHAVGRWIYEAPAGTMDEGELPEETARRELAEETGLAAARWEPAGCIYTTPGFTDEVIYLFAASELSPAPGASPDEDEMIEVVRIPCKRVGQMIRDGSIVDAKTICLAVRCLG
ncbi:MAG: NUDIX hydrolase [Methanomicrobiales archaeon]|nr:NUDIX hydrolase [Methanomicrobiales archaeon]